MSDEPRFERLGDETWRDVVARIASVYGLEGECLEYYDDGGPEDEAKRAWEALYEWDCLPLAAIGACRGS